MFDNFENFLKKSKSIIKELVSPLIKYNEWEKKMSLIIEQTLNSLLES